MSDEQIVSALAVLIWNSRVLHEEGFEEEIQKADAAGRLDDLHAANALDATSLYVTARGHVRTFLAALPE